MSDGDPRVTNLTVEEVARGLTEGSMLLVDVREPNEIAIERYPDAVVVPLSAFDPAAIPDPQGKQVVFACRSGRRSVTASLAAQEQGLSLYGASGGRHPGVEGRRPADRELGRALKNAGVDVSIRSSDIRRLPVRLVRSTEMAGSQASARTADWLLQFERPARHRMAGRADTTNRH